MRVLVTGATGFIGRNLVKRLLLEKFEVVCTGRSLDKLTRFSGGIEKAYLNIEDKENVKEVFMKHRPEAIFHCAALTADQSLDKLRRVNVEGSRNIFDVSLQIGVTKIIYLSSISVIAGNTVRIFTEGLPYAAINRYGQSKIEVEELAIEYRKKGLKIALLRPAMVYGEDDPHAVSLLIDLIRWRIVPIIENGGNKFPLVYVDNVVDVMMISLSLDMAYEGSYIITDSEMLSTKEIIGYIAKLWGAKMPICLSNFCTPLILSLPLIGKRLRILAEDKTYSIKRLKEKLGYVPRITFYEGMARTVEAHKRILIKQPFITY